MVISQGLLGLWTAGGDHSGVTQPPRTAAFSDEQWHPGRLRLPLARLRTPPVALELGELPGDRAQGPGF